jgi:hypothetical protein
VELKILGHIWTIRHNKTESHKLFSVLRSFCVDKETDKQRKEIEDLMNELFED